ncbi:MAG: hypothetical protein ACR2NZ_18450 [Rubripirellula sp.]
MFRSLMLFVAVAGCFHTTEARAQGRSYRSHGHSGQGATIQRYETGRQYGRSHKGYRSNRPSSSFGFSIGIGGYPGYGGFGYFDPYRFDGYGYDPYRHGSFEAPDLLNDPYFRERHRYDSKYPGRYRAPLVMRSAPAVNYDAYRNATPTADVNATPRPWVDPSELASRLQASTEQLNRTLQTSQHGESWIEYLSPNEIPSLIAAGNIRRLRELLTHYDGVVGNPQLRNIANAKGFADTRGLLQQVLTQPVQQPQPSGNPLQRDPTPAPPTPAPPAPQRLPVPETLPAPAPEPSESTSASFLDV